MFPKGGGGGSAKTGIVNMIVLLKYDEKKTKLIELDAYSTELSVPWTIKFVKNTSRFIAGIGSMCREFDIRNEKYSFFGL